MMFYIIILLIMGAFTILNKQTTKTKQKNKTKQQQQQQQQDYVRMYGTNAGIVALPLQEPPFPI